MLPPPITDLSEAQTWIEVGFLTLGLHWQHPRVLGFMARVSERLGKPIRHRGDLPPEAIEALAEKLKQELGL